jgi:2-oxoisovalerate dehydrogenase E1 component
MTEAQKLAMLERMMLIRNLEMRIKQLYRGGEITGAIHLCIGQEAVAVGACESLRDDDYVTSTHRSHGHTVGKRLALNKTMAELMGRETGHCRGRGGSMHVFDVRKGFLGGNGIVGGGIAIALGAAFAAKYHKTDQVAVCFFSEGASNQGVFHECLNMASLWKLPIIYLCENNQYAATTPVSRSASTRDIAPRAEGYGLPWDIADGNDVLDVHRAVNAAVARARAGDGATLVECKTYRIEPHCGIIADQRPKEEICTWQSDEKDPILRFQKTLLDEGAATQADIDAMQARTMQQLDEAVEFARKSPFPEPESLRDGFLVEDAAPVIEDRPAFTRTLRYADALNEAIDEEMARDDSVFLIGEDVDLYGGVFNLSQNLVERHGAHRVVGTPISEQGFVGLCVGAAMAGLRPIVEIMYIDFIMLAMDQLANQMAKLRYMSGGQFTMPVTIRAQAGTGTAEAAQHSQSLEAWFVHIPGFKVAMPATSYDAKGLLKAAIRDDNPVLVIENRVLFYDKKEEGPEGEWLVPLGKAEVVRKGDDVTVVALGYVRRKAVAAAEQVADLISVEVIDPRTLHPLDLDTILASVRKTGRLLVVHEAPERCGMGAEIVRRVTEEGFDLLTAPPRVLGQVDVPIPFSSPLEQAAIPQVETIASAIEELSRAF